MESACNCFELIAINMAIRRKEVLLIRPTKDRLKNKLLLNFVIIVLFFADSSYVYSLSTDVL